MDVFDKMRDVKKYTEQPKKFDVLKAIGTVKTKSAEADLADYLGRAVGAFRQGEIPSQFFPMYKGLGLGYISVISHVQCTKECTYFVLTHAPGMHWSWNHIEERLSVLACLHICGQLPVKMR